MGPFEDAAGLVDNHGGIVAREHALCNGRCGYNADLRVASWFQALSKDKFRKENQEDTTTINENTDQHVLHYLIDL